MLNPPIAFNVSHDNEIVTISFSSNAHNPPAYSLGIDVMKVHLTRHDTFHSFIDTMREVVRSVSESCPSFNALIVANTTGVSSCNNREIRRRKLTTFLLGMDHERGFY